ncbi:hypothetical protein GALMADRAFT_223751 [Galerina marginata CBS 339.88]|uniref:DUF6533 domain-containing protein n=1 Tax=Galerina marginata (strain CBS 339.88) TaxID=685588 RepID=A0A067TI76_GALM3|nr:hypothetical protein GALMADRAFT_223751 [Galerina marginata CBS 339.88]
MSELAQYDRVLLENITIRQWSTLSTLAIILYEYTITFREELRHIWKRPITVVRMVYLFSRYLAIIVQSVNLYLVLGPFSALSTPERICKGWFSFQLTAACVLMAALDLILMLRLYALYSKSFKVGTLLTLLFCGQIAVEAVIAPRSVLQVPYDPICDTTRTHPDILYFCISVWVTHIAMGLLTAAKWELAALRAPVVKLVTRDGTWILVTICALFAVIVPYGLIGQVSKAHVAFGWPISIISISVCENFPCNCLLSPKD